MLGDNIDIMKLTKDMIIRDFGESFLKRSALRIRQGDKVIEKFLKGKNYNTILEIGTYRGATAAFMSQFCDHVITIDLKNGICERYGENGKEIRENLWKHFGIENITGITVTDDKEKKKIVDDLNFDFAFIDGAHDPTISNDFSLVRRCGRVLFHEYDNTSPNQNYSFDFVNRNLKKDRLIVDDIFALWLAPGIIQ